MNIYDKVVAYRPNTMAERVGQIGVASAAEAQQAFASNQQVAKDLQLKSPQH